MTTLNKTLVICGDSFNYGIGCKNLYTEPYGALVANYLGWDLIRLARGSASNYVIYLQGDFASKLEPKPSLVILGTTSYDRIEWVETGKELPVGEDVKLEHVNYHLYPAHHHTPPHHEAPMPFHLQNDPKYNPKILSEQIVGITDYLKFLKQGNKNGYYQRLHPESIYKLELIENYYMGIFDYKIKRDYDIGSIMLSYLLLKKKGIPTIILGPDMKYKELVLEEGDYFNQDWGYCTTHWPDSVNSLHTSEEGHKYTADRLIDHLKRYNFI